MSLLLRDSIDPFAIPLEGLAAVAGYGDGSWTWPSAGWARFPSSIVALSIVVRPGDVGDVADVETGDFGPADAPGFVRGFQRPGRRAATLYCNRVTWPAVVGALRAAGLDAAAVDWWIATLDGTTDVWFGRPGVGPPAGLRVVAVQARGSDQTGGAYDESVILDPSWVGLEDDMTPDQSAKLDRIYTAIVSGVEDPSDKTQFQKVVEAYLEPLTPPAIAQAVVAALPPAAAGGLSEDQVQAAVAAAVQPLVDQLARAGRALQGT